MNQDPEDIVNLCVCFACVLCAALAAGLTIGLMVSEDFRSTIFMGDYGREGVDLALLACYHPILFLGTEPPVHRSFGDGNQTKSGHSRRMPTGGWSLRKEKKWIMVGWNARCHNVALLPFIIHRPPSFYP